MILYILDLHRKYKYIYKKFINIKNIKYKI